MLLSVDTMETESGRHKLTCLPLTTQPGSLIFPGVAAISVAMVYWEEDLNRATTAPVQETLLMVRSREAAGHED